MTLNALNIIHEFMIAANYEVGFAICGSGLLLQRTMAQCEIAIAHCGRELLTAPPGRELLPARSAHHGCWLPVTHRQMWIAVIGVKSLHLRVHAEHETHLPCSVPCNS